MIISAEIVEAGLAGSRSIELKLGDASNCACLAASARHGGSDLATAPAFLGRYRMVFGNGRACITLRVIATP
jgi:hypothetical protein